MAVARTLRSESSVNYLDTTADSLTLTLNNGGPRPGNHTHIILVKGANTATLSGANTVINFSPTTHSGVTTVTWNNVGDSLTLIWEVTSKKWSILSYYGVAFS